MLTMTFHLLMSLDGCDDDQKKQAEQRQHIGERQIFEK